MSICADFVSWQQEQQNACGTPSFGVEVSDPVKQGSGLNAFVTYKVTYYRLVEKQASETRTQHEFLIELS